jgi:hypothetical protein
MLVIKCGTLLEADLIAMRHDRFQAGHCTLARCTAICAVDVEDLHVIP